MKCVSVSFKTAPEEIRDKFAFTDYEKEKFTKDLSKFSKDIKCVILTTCNRTEIYVESGCGIFIVLENLLSQKTGLSISEIRKYAKYYENRATIEHIFKVACGLDSMILGENEILSQVKNTYLEALQKNNTGYELNTTFLSALSCAKKIKTETEISKTALSYATLACNEIKRFVQNIPNPSIMIIGGSGQMGASIIKNLVNNKFRVKIYATKRVHVKGLNLDSGVEIIDYLERYEYLKSVDVVVSATKSSHYTINYEDARKYILPNRKMLFIDLALPYDIDREIQNLNNCKLITVDYFETIVQNNYTKKEKAINNAYSILDNELQKIYKNIIYHNALPSLHKQDNLSLYRLKDKLDADSFEAVINKIEKEGSYAL